MFFPGRTDGSNSGSGSSNSSNNSGKDGKDDGPSGHHDPQQPVILVGNFGDGHINIFTQDGQYQGQLQSHNRTIVIDGLWLLSFAPATAAAIDPNRLYFTAGPAKEADGIFGYLIKQ